MVVESVGEGLQESFDALATTKRDVEHNKVIDGLSSEVLHSEVQTAESDSSRDGELECVVGGHFFDVALVLALLDLNFLDLPQHLLQTLV